MYSRRKMANVARNVTASVGPSMLHPTLGGVMILVAVVAFSCGERIVEGFDEAIVGEKWLPGRT